MIGSLSLADCVGWSATAVFVSSYFFDRAAAIRRVQMAGAAVWLTYGLLLQSYPVIVSNVLVIGAAALTGSGARNRSRSLRERPPTEPSR